MGIVHLSAPLCSLQRCTNYLVLRQKDLYNPISHIKEENIYTQKKKRRKIIITINNNKIK